MPRTLKTGLPVIENWSQSLEWRFLKNLEGHRKGYATWLRDKGHLWRARALEIELKVFAGEPLDPEERADLRSMRRDVDTGWWDMIWRGRSIYLCGQDPKRAFEFVCPVSWEGLETPERIGVRDCSGCGEQVYAAEGIEQAKRLADAGRCIAVPDGFGAKGVVVAGRPKRGWRVERALREHDTEA
jgi:hypothetical protein